jgi:hypothetical protein
MKFISLVVTVTLFCSHAIAQEATVHVGSPEINRDYLVNRNVFQRLSWIDASGRLIGSATLNCVTWVDSVKKRLIYLQLRNDGKRDSTISQWPDLKPIYTSETAGAHKDSYDYQSGNGVRVLTTNNGKVLVDSTAQLPAGSFDSFLTDYLIGALPLKVGYTAEFNTNSGGSYNVRIKQVMNDMLFSPNGQPVPIWLVQVNSNGYEILYWVDKTTHEMLKSVVTMPNGGVFMKSKI